MLRSPVAPPRRVRLNPLCRWLESQVFGVLLHVNLVPQPELCQRPGWFACGLRVEPFPLEDPANALVIKNAVRRRAVEEQAVLVARQLAPIPVVAWISDHCAIEHRFRQVPLERLLEMRLHADVAPAPVERRRQAG